MKPILYLDNWDRPQPTNRFERLLVEHGLEVVRVQSSRSPLPDMVDFDGVFVGPSDSAAYDDTAWIRAEQAYLRCLADAGIPILGLCFGSQTLAWALLGKGSVYRRKQREQGFGLISLTPEGRADPLTHALPDQTEVFHWHGDEIVADHPDLVLLAKNDACGNQIWRWRNGPVWGVQPHPEYDADGFKAWFDADSERFRRSGIFSEEEACAPLSCDDAGSLFNNFVRILTDRSHSHQGK